MSEVFKILCVDDEPDMEMLIRQKYRKEIRKGIYDFYFALDGEKALDLLNEYKDIYLVLSDINMPVMDGLSLLNEIQKLEKPEMKVVMVSAYGDMQNIRTAMNRGAFDFINKPIDFEDFTKTIEKAHLEINRIQKQVQTAHVLEVVEDDLSAAAKIQDGLLPKLSGLFKANERLNVASFIKPARWGGGDFYDVFAIDDKRIGFIIADVSGKGIPAAVFMYLSRTTLRIYSSLYENPSDVLSAANEYLNVDNDSSMFVTVFYAVLNTETNEFMYSNAGHNPPYLISNGEISAMPITKNMALGVMPSLPYADLTISLKSGDKFFMFTDGVSECMNEANEEYGEERIEQFLSDHINEDVVTLVDKMNNVLSRYQGNAEQHDDITMLSFQFD
ncbi:MAG: SpoIIE family protein phosphatase [Bacteroidales bacterium]|nr:SpoIIE family protein phosphatase [Bacteroidales bacterium]